MQLAAFQNLVVALYLSADERAAWARDPAMVVRAYGLDPDGAAALTGVPPADLAFYAHGLVAKRVQEAAAFLPLTVAVAGATFHERFQRYTATCVPAGPKHHVADILAFGRSVTRDARSLSREAVDVLRYELMPWELNFRLEEKMVVLRASGARLRSVRARRVRGVRWRVVRFSSRVPRVVEALASRPLLVPPATGRTASLGVFVKLPLLARPLEWYVPHWAGRRRRA